MKKEYTREDLTVVWQPDLCIHSGICFSTLPSVFKPRERPWVDVNGADKEAIIQTVHKCPSGALSLKETKSMSAETPVESTLHHVTVLTNGPLRIKHPCQVQLANGEIVEKLNGVSLCRCGGSANKPFCDGSHKTNGFIG